MDVVELTRALIRFETVNPPGREEASARFVGQMLSADGFRVSYHTFAPERTSLIAHSPGVNGVTNPLPLTWSMGKSMVEAPAT